MHVSRLCAGFGVALTTLALSPDAQYGLKQLAAVVLKKYVKEHWQEGEKHYTPPTVLDAEKAEIRRLLPQARAGSPKPAVFHLRCPPPHPASSAGQAVCSSPPRTARLPRGWAKGCRTLDIGPPLNGLKPTWRAWL